ncbi:MogA/MoaB family molybdenum cofactor biosynthesis protein [Thermoleptolyngbya sp. C42_A2020_037]|uniref:MogA/MoaB family molybdenum cofactor biosynthesis protein n=1 Tax=Thermoleptolyngbya sp. C42_A2020_037 TaxID=2747799 RepID=UPI0019D958FC|nr:MogA/MoaB family molybdenum cofactor biosynthesis protein [Thermoleptolyngbya sp. C42_A2020_037]MBF2085589.1 MogA/MoaB family molybdenum cofactor biosynthesis protein [Thermoleptolyngbya sp. C42_A2020_037]
MNYAALPHPDTEQLSVGCAVITVSDTRTPETDRSGQLTSDRLQSGGHRVLAYEILPDEPEQIRTRVLELCDRPDISAILLNGGTGIAPRDTTYDAIESLLDKTLPGFGEVFRWLSYQEIGSRAIASRATAGLRGTTLIFSLPGSSNAVRLAMDALILPELVHLTQQVQGTRNLSG